MCSLQAFASAAIVNFFLEAESGSFDVVLPEVVDQLLKLLQAGNTFVMGHALEALTILARYMEERFEPVSPRRPARETFKVDADVLHPTQFYSRIMPDLLNLLSTEPADETQESLRAKALDCSAHIGAAVPTATFAPDAPRLLQIMHNISISLPDDDEVTRPYLLTSLCGLAVTVGAEAFGPYINDAFPKLLEGAAKKPELALADDEHELPEDDDWEDMEVGGERAAIR